MSIDELVNRIVTVEECDATTVKQTTTGGLIKNKIEE
jgi:hypothetical protein